MMKNLIMLAFFAIFVFACNSDQSNEKDETTEEGKEKQTQTGSENAKKYEVESAHVSYKIIAMGNESTLDIKFKEFGKIQSTVFSDQGKEMTILLKDGFMYSYENGQNKGIKFNASADMVGAENQMGQFSIKTILDEGGKKVGTEAILTKNCEVYELLKDGIEYKFMIWKNIPLKIVANNNGMEVVTEATEVNESPDFSTGTFDLPENIEFMEENSETESDFDVEGAQG